MASDAAEYVAVITEFVEALVHQILFVREVSDCYVLMCHMHPDH